MAAIQRLYEEEMKKSQILDCDSESLAKVDQRLAFEVATFLTSPIKKDGTQTGVNHAIKLKG